jgi:hypothetical protein
MTETNDKKWLVILGHSAISSLIPSGMKDLLDLLTPHFATVIATSWALANMENTLRQLLVPQDKWPKIYHNATVEEPRLYLGLATLQKMPPSHCILVDEKPINIIAAVKAGMHGIRQTQGGSNPMYRLYVPWMDGYSNQMTMKQAIQKIMQQQAAHRPAAAVVKTPQQKPTR